MLKAQNIMVRIKHNRFNVKGKMITCQECSGIMPVVVFPQQQDGNVQAGPGIKLNRPKSIGGVVKAYQTFVSFRT